MQQMVSLLQILLLARYVSGTIMPIIRSSRVSYRRLLPVVFGALVFKLSVWCGAVRFAGCCSRWFIYCRSYCLLNMFRAPLCPSSGAQEYHRGGCCLWYLVLWFSSCRSGVELWVVCPVCGLPQAATTLLMMGIMVPETC